MTRWLLLALSLQAVPAAAQDGERVAEIRVHGNHTTPSAEILALSGLAVGDPATAERLQQAQDVLETTGRFESVEVRRRYLSIEDPTPILVMIVVDERPPASAGIPLPGPLRWLQLSTMWIPVLGYADGYGFTYGARFAFIDPFGPRSRISVPLTWGGERRAAFDVERTFARGPVTGITGSLAAYRRVNPHFDVPDVRLEARGRVERRLTPWLRLGAEARTARVDFGGVERRHTTGGADVVVDTRLDPSFPRNAVHAIAGWERVDFEQGSAGRWRADVRGYVGVLGSNVLALRGQLIRSDGALPPAEQPLLGGSASLRGYRTGYRAGDSLAAASAELRVPLTSPLSFARMGIKVLVDAGTTWAAGTRLTQQAFDRGVGGGFYVGVAAFMVNVDVAWPESGRRRAHVGMGVTF
jgi:hypothetical protein